ncbi:PREDICTED: uncharacterized protein LOC107063843 [Polistes dominula]|uniref:Uncharacterized protein LOC107063843 n=1 Tax=Polistes dominula TaxID=743375 RepID=A0ABM1HU12_POLDO|nr:PREDICTED: uncharacterized protein LOC107063843 [Polistes dominula]
MSVRIPSEESKNESDFKVVNTKETISNIKSSKSNIFDVYTTIFRLIIVHWIPRVCLLEEEKREKELDDLILPSNTQWRHQVYYKLVELQRERDVEIIELDSTSSIMVETRRKDEKGTKLKDPQDYEWSPGKLERIVKAKILKEDDSSSLLATFSSNGSMTETYIEPGWRIEDILLAAKVLENKEESQPFYSNEAEMRRVFGLVYDVLRYKNVLNYVLQDIGFWSRNHELKNRERIVWLLLYDMQGRKFSRRGDIVTIKTRDRIFKAIGLKNIENALLEVRTHLAASMSRLRIAESALTLDKLLPKHLRSGEGIVWSEESAIASGWINTSNGSISKKELIKELSNKVQLELCENCEVAELDENIYVFDSFCPKVINIHEKARERVACSSLVREHRFIFLERSLCLGAAAIAEAMRIGRLCGPVVLTHSIAPRHTGYLAELLSSIEGAGRLLAFGTGDRRYEYEDYLKKLGITLQQCRVFSEKYISPPPSVEIDRATVVLATPPSSYIGVKDIVDLVVARGGDTKLLESLTNTDDELSKTHAVLTEQLTTLKYALTRPNVQFLIYEVHTVLPAETTKMVQQVVDYANQLATEKYIHECLPKKKIVLKEKQGQNNITKMSTKQFLRGKNHSKDEEQFKETSITDSCHADKVNQHEEDEILSSKTYCNINVPKSDLFEVRSFDEIYGRNSTKILEPGCFMAVIKRKEMMQFDSLFMIKVAESKGLFGDTNKEQSTSKPIVTATQPIIVPAQRVKRKIDIYRLMMPTHSSIQRHARKSCSRFIRHFMHCENYSSLRARNIKKKDIRRWWKEAIEYFLRSEHAQISSEFRAMRTDPFTRRFLYPSRKRKLVLSRSKNDRDLMTTSGTTCDILAKPLDSFLRSFQKFQSIAEISKSLNDNKGQVENLKDKRISSTFTYIKDKAIPRIYQKVSSKVFLSNNVKSNTLRQRSIKQGRSDIFDILQVSEKNVMDELNSSNNQHDAVLSKKQEIRDKESQRFLSSTALRKSALIRATQRTSFDNVFIEHDKRYQQTYTNLERSFKRYHHSNSIRNLWQIPLKSPLETVLEDITEIPYFSHDNTMSQHN